MTTSAKPAAVAFLLILAMHGIADAQPNYPYFGPPPTGFESNAAPSSHIAISIVGVWKLRQEYPDSVLNYRFEFRRNGSYTMRYRSTDSSGNANESTIQGRYTVNEFDGTIQMVVQGNKQTSALQILGDVLLLEDDDDQLTFVFRRAENS